MKSVGIRDPNKNYNIIYDGYGTGLSPPTENEWYSMVDRLKIVEDISSSISLKSSLDLSSDSCFPKVDSQGSQGSCSAWATTYYSNGYIQAKNNGWTGARIGKKDQLLSPAFTFNKCNYGKDGGSSTINNARVMQSVGVCRLNQMDYNPSNYINWGNENAWRDAPEYRIDNIYQLRSPYDDSDISAIKAALTEGSPVVFSLNADSFKNFGGDDVLGSTAMISDHNHAQCIVGYDDSKRDAETGQVGAFKVVNSWGSSWGPKHNGYYWITYTAFKGSWNNYYSLWFDDLYTTETPKLLGVWEFNPPCDRDASIGIALDENNIRRPEWDGHSDIMHDYPGFMCLDITEFYDKWSSDNQDFMLGIYDAFEKDGTIISFTIEYYGDNYKLNSPSEVSAESPDTPQSTPGEVSISFFLPVHNIEKNKRYSSIQGAINDADSGNTIEVSASVIYHENLLISKSINLVGEYGNKPVIDGKGKDTVIIISEDNVEINGFIIQNSGENNYDAGIKIYSNDNIIKENDIQYNIKGIDIESSDFNEITSNAVVNNQIGITLTTSSDNHLMKNIINNSEYGIYIQSNSINNIVTENCVLGNSNGIFTMGSWDNIFYHNNFVDNDIDAYDSSINIWNDEYPSGGNFWSKYTGTDIDGDGIGDTPYNIMGDTNQDRYPYLKYKGWLQADLDCDRNLSWIQIKPGDTVLGSFTVENIGDSGSILDWEIVESPEWGIWTFTPEEGDDLTPEDGSITVTVSVVAPDKKNKEFSGKITIVNKENSSDYEIINVFLTTPKNKPINTPFLRFLENHPRMFPILRHLLGL